ncbi:hypothetical protein F5148DRAFT_267160 [Russula earlei]|uniref:Uncharacterized protein n=1 Tax=Russula earlei TaxID=71964 RepID=A0ACC0UKP2_9AGAM|nr:hypothetical protein F5148DRAFT_267160 [Russula earlei]
MTRPPPPLELELIASDAPNISAARDRFPSAPPAPDPAVPTSSPPPLSSSEMLHQRCASSPSRRRPVSRRQSSISYLPADSPRLWTARTPLMGSGASERGASSSSGANNGKKVGHVRTLSVPQRSASEHMGLTLPERHAELLHSIAQKESKCLELRSQLVIHESELLQLKRKWERVVHREFGRDIPSMSPRPSAAVLEGLVGGVRALAAATTSPPFAPAMSRLGRSSSVSAKRMTRQMASNSVSSTTATTSSSAPSVDGDSPRLSQSSVSSVAEEKPDADKGQGRLEEDIAPNAASVPRQKRSPTSSTGHPSPSGKIVRRRSGHSASGPLADALRPLTGESSHARSGKRASIGAVSPTSLSIPGIIPLSAMGLGRANLGETAQGWVDSVGSKLAELQRRETFSKSHKRASVLLSDVSQSIFSALAPAASVNTAPASAPPTRSLIDEDDEDGNTALGHAMLPDVITVSARPAPQTALASSTERIKDEDDDDWNW